MDILDIYATQKERMNMWFGPTLGGCQMASCRFRFHPPVQWTGMLGVPSPARSLLLPLILKCNWGMLLFFKKMLFCTQ